MSHIAAVDLLALLDEGAIPDLAETSALKRRVAVWTGSSLTTVLLHEYAGDLVPCVGPYCWHCARDQSPHVLGACSALLVDLQRLHKPRKHVLLCLMNESECQQALGLAVTADGLRGSAVALVDGQLTAQDWPHPLAVDRLPPAIDPLAWMLPLFTSYARYGVWGPVVRVEVPREHLPLPRPLRERRPHSRGEG